MSWFDCCVDYFIGDICMIFGLYKLKKENEKLKEDNGRLQKEVNRLLDQVNGTITAADVHFDFKNVNAFSVERLVNDNKPCTIIGYFRKEPVLSSDGEMIVEKDVVEQWYLYCNEERHQQLINEFRKSKGIK